MTDLSRIVQDLEQQRDAIDKALTALRDVGGAKAATTSSTKAVGPPRKRQMSEAGRKAIGDAARRRWAAQKSASEAANTGTANQPIKRAVTKKKALKRSAA
jgi:hypothetical protein